MEGGYDLLFVGDPPRTLECSICMHIYRDPFLVSCCGNHFCESCITRVMANGKNCPLCNQPGFSVMLDRGLQRQVNGLQVNCSNKDRGCAWVGELGKLKEHLLVPDSSPLPSCKFEVIECSQGCGERYQRRFVGEHHKKSCICRPYICKYCDYGSIYEDVCKNHWPICPNYPVKCPNQCDSKMLPRCEVDKHVENECPLTKLECEFSYAGCKAHILRKDMAEHISSNFLQHLSQVSEVSVSLLASNQKKDKQIAQLKKDNQALKYKISDLKTAHAKEKEDLKKKLEALEARVFPVFPYSITMSNFTQHKLAGDRWFSPAFYSAPKGYKMCLRVDANGISTGKGTHISVLVHFEAGEYDDVLEWPFTGYITVRLVNQKANSDHHEVIIPFTPDTPYNTRSRITVGGVATWGWGCYTYISHDDLEYDSEKNCEYLTNNCLQFVVTQVELDSTRHNL